MHTRSYACTCMCCEQEGSQVTTFPPDILQPMSQLPGSQQASQSLPTAPSQGMELLQPQQQPQRQQQPASTHAPHVPAAARQQAGRGRGRYIPVSGRGRKPLFGPGSG